MQEKKGQSPKRKPLDPDSLNLQAILRNSANVAFRAGLIGERQWNASLKRLSPRKRRLHQPTFIGR